ncbi:hypothetical protein CAPTEDRAFT_171728 [Capitella teleta]|uniref:Enhancer of mRNA-decapping protein 3 n=1 Tax=Capitella teleta TaxID=283909 RepID=R7T3K3_CAPTE|nr:hypothetical protein CAPTEDRAFT_171728 [Capitella teleta]|eukprot:ELT87191.1 hypothetical protein CAPTEDRAFT_171728 [Capitella teleta]
MESYIGSVVSIHCGDVLGTYQGVVLQIDGGQQTLTLSEPFCNGMKGKVSTVTINAADIKDLKIIRNKEEAKVMPKVNHIHKPTKSSDIKPTVHRPPSANDTVVEVKSEPPKPQSHQLTAQGHQGSSRGWVSPRKMDQARSSPRRPTGRKEDCFSPPVASFANDEFDFEKNLALFDKQAVFAAIEGHSPMNTQKTSKIDNKYRCDENVIPSKPAVFRQILTAGGGDDAEGAYLTDAGLLVPSVSHELRSRLMKSAADCGLSCERQVEAVGRSAAEMILQLLGGNHRLTPQNAHQRPRVTVLCGPHMQGAQALNCARHLAMHTVQVTAFVPSQLSTLASPESQSELSLLRMTKTNIVTNPNDLPSSGVEMVVSGLDGHDCDNSHEPWAAAVVEWYATIKASALAIDPPTGPGGSSLGVPKWGLSIALPLHGAHTTCSQMYLCDLSLPTGVFSAASVKYTSPFGHKFVIPLHKKE